MLKRVNNRRRPIARLSEEDIRSIAVEMFDPSATPGDSAAAELIFVEFFKKQKHERQHGMANHHGDKQLAHGAEVISFHVFLRVAEGLEGFVFLWGFMFGIVFFFL